jgi:hypothetical protein
VRIMRSMVSYIRHSQCFGDTVLISRMSAASFFGGKL